MYTPTRRRFLTATATTTLATALATTPAAAADTTTATNSTDDIIYTNADTPSRNGDWNQLRQGRVFIYYPDGYYQDAELIQEYLSFAHEHVRNYLTINPDHEIELYLLHPDEHDDKEITHTILINDDEYTTNTIYATLPTEHPRYDPDYQEEQVEYDTYDKGENGVGKAYKHHLTLAYTDIVVTRIVANTRGIHNHNTVTPPWVIEGIPMYIAVYGTDVNEHNAQAHIESERSEITHDSTARFDYLETQDQPYVGAIFTRFIVDTWSWGHVRQYIKTPANSFNENVQRVFGVTAHEFENQWLQWLNANYDAGYTITTPTPTQTTTSKTTTESAFNQTYADPVQPDPEEPNPLTNPFLQAAVALAATATALGGYVTYGLLTDNEDDDDGDEDDRQNAPVTAPSDTEDTGAEQLHDAHTNTHHRFDALTDPHHTDTTLDE